MIQEFRIGRTLYVTDTEAHVEIGDKFIGPSVKNSYNVFKCVENNRLTEDEKEYYESENMISATPLDESFYFGIERKHCYKIINEL